MTLSERIDFDRARRHLAAFLGDCGIRSCTVCHPPVPVRSPWVEIALNGRLPAKEYGR